MQSFKQYLSEAKIDFAPWQHPDSGEYQHLDKYDIAFGSSSKLRRNKNGTYSTSERRFSAKYIERNGEFVLPVKYATVVDFDTINSKEQGITSVWGFPDLVQNNLSIDSPHLESLEHLNTKAHMVFLSLPKLNTMGNCSIKCSEMQAIDTGSVSFKEFAKCVEIASLFKVSFRALFNKPVLSLLKIPGSWSSISPRFVTSENKMTAEEQDEVKKVVNILNNNRNNIIGAQEELFKNGLDQYAKL